MTVPTLFHLRVWTRFRDPPERVWAVKTDPAVIRSEFPPGMGLCVEDEAALAEALADGHPCTLDARWGLARMPWPLRIEEVVPGVRYRDSSENALFSRFEHEHIFEPTPDGCRYLDAVTFSTRMPTQKAVALLVQRLFVRRHRVAARHLHADRHTVGVAVLRVKMESET